jgi:PKD repeat protein
MYFKPIFLLLIISQWINGLWAQSDGRPCGFDAFNNPVIMQKSMQVIDNAIANRSANSTESSDSIRWVPVVVHVIHNDGSENISEAQIESQIMIMNEDFGKILGTNGDGNGVDTKVRFCLAKIDPQGRCTNGIVRIKSELTVHQQYQRALLKELSFWDNTRYLNIYVVRSINGGVGGYASFPGGPPSEDGIVVRNDLFGDIGTGKAGLGRTATHELGHWLGVFHTFQNGCGIDTCLDGDGVCDTPPVDKPNFGCPTNANTCSNDVPDLPDQVDNYMDYTDDNCKSMFSKGQAMRMMAAMDSIRWRIWSDSNLVSTGCDTNYQAPANCPVIADFITLNKSICTGGEIEFMGKMLNNIQSWNWIFQGGTPSTSTDQNPRITYNSPGIFNVQLIVSDSFSTDTLLLSGYIEVNQPGLGASLDYFQDFEGDPFKGLTINNPDGGVTWELDSAAAKSGKYSLKIDNLINTNYGSVDEIILNDLDLTSLPGGSAAFLQFDWAYARSSPTFSDDLIVLVSNDCGLNYTRVFFGTGAALATGPTQTTPFIPDSSQWKHAKINLFQVRNDSSVQIKLVNVTDGGNNLYIDNIYVGAGSPPTGIELREANEELVTVYPNPFSRYVIFELNDRMKYDSGLVLQIFSAYGNEVKRITNLKPGSNLMDRDNLPAGIYLFVVRDNTRIVQSGKIVIQ